ncbi:hypothetical protein Tco_0104846 [Tanacetum coccineum]
MKLIIKHILSHHNTVSKRPQSDKHGIKIDTVLGNLKFINKGEEHLKYGMAVLEEMMSDTIKASSSYLNYMAKSLGTQSGKGQGKRLNTKKDVESEEFVDSKSLEETKADKEKICLNERHSSLVIGREENKEIDEGTLDHSTMKLKGVENVSSVAQYLLDMKKATKASKNDYILQQHPKGAGDGSSMIPDTPNDPTDSSTSSHSGSDDETPLVDTIVKILPEKTTHSPKPQPPQSKTKIIIKTPKQSEEKVNVEVVLKSLMKLEKKVATMSKIDHIEEIKISIQANVINEVKNQMLKFLPKAVFEYVQPKMERIVRYVRKKNPINLFQSSFTSVDSLTKYELKHKLYDMMQKSCSFLANEKHLELFNALMNSMGVDESVAKGDLDRTIKLNKKQHDDEDPHVDLEKEKKKRQKDTDASKS